MFWYCFRCECRFRSKIMLWYRFRCACRLRNNIIYVLVLVLV